MGQLVSGYIDFAERQAERRQPITMADWVKHLDKILIATSEELLQDAGKISHQQAVDKAATEYKKYHAKTLSNAEVDYLNSIKIIEKKLPLTKDKKDEKNFR
ncbi:MAG: virulence RhuM family protein, partial [Deferribacterales bacterium]|nr:virulence RhuM family protein [Deferribacterales bacterium]